MKKKGLTKSEIDAEFDRAMNTSSPNPRYGGLTPNQVLQRLKSKPKKSKSEDQERSELQLST